MSILKLIVFESDFTRDFLNYLDELANENLMLRIFNLIKEDLIEFSCHNRGNFLVIKYVKLNIEYYSRFIQHLFIEHLDNLIDDKHGLIILCKLIELSDFKNIDDLCYHILTKES